MAGQVEVAEVPQNLYLIQRRAGLAQPLGGLVLHQSEVANIHQPETGELVPFLIDVANNSAANLIPEDSPDLIVAYPQDKIWTPDGISLDRRVQADPNLLARVTEALRPDNLKNYIVFVDPKAPTRCIDGRILAILAELSELPERALGPKVAGGIAHAALAHRIVDIGDLQRGQLFEHDVDFVANLYQGLGLSPGGHIDDHRSQTRTGCGAIDNIDLILDRIEKSESHLMVLALTKLIMGEGYDEDDAVSMIIGRIQKLAAAAPSYMPRENGKPVYIQKVVDIIRKHSQSEQELVPALAGAHNEIGLVLNTVPGTTIDTDRFSHDYDNQIQIFGWDLWEIEEEAKRLYPASANTPLEIQLHAVRKQRQYITTRVILGVATTMVLSDGSLKVVTIKPAKA